MRRRVLNEEDGSKAIFCPACRRLHSFPAKDYNGDEDRPTFTGSRKFRERGKVCHLHVQRGEAIFLSDCTHDMAGMNVPLPEI